MITFIGMPGAGKSCMSRFVGKRLNRKIVDGDRLIEQNTGRRLQEIIDTDGLEAFKEIERETLLSITDTSLIVSPGGSAVYYDDVMRHFKDNGIIVYLYVSFNTMKQRLGDYSQRGVVLKPGTTLEDLYNEREPLLREYADIIVNCDGNAFPRYHAETMDKISKLIEENPTI
jgi:shikimate kinase